ncbi:MAG: 2-oxoacid:acceptor oxidoreductase family protein [Coriobacteriia bacterium]|nr:2-oxoacid:acceptor oxidoreductase family protein [Coriobacteriia bacterium]
MSELTEIRWHARAGQGAVTAAKLVAETAMYEDRYMQAMPEYGPERTGAPLKAFTRISDQPIEVCNNIENPGIVVVLDETLLSSIDVLEGIEPDGAVIVNTTEPPEEMRKIMKAPDTVTVATVDASGIALDTIKRDIPNTPIVGALVKVRPIVGRESVDGQLLKTFGKKFAQEMIDANLESVQRAYEEVLIDG